MTHTHRKICLTGLMVFGGATLNTFAAPEKKPVERGNKVVFSKTVKVRFSELGLGFDGPPRPGAPTVPWLSVPLLEPGLDPESYGENVALVTVTPEANISNVFTRNIAKVKTRLSSKLDPVTNTNIRTGTVTILGYRRGETTMRAMTANSDTNAQEVSGVLNVVVRKRRTLSVNFILVSDDGHSTPIAKDPAKIATIIDEYIDGANAIWGPQANVYFERKNMYYHKISGNTNVYDISDTTNFDKITSKVIPEGQAADKDVYFVWETTDTAAGVARQSNREVVLAGTTTRAIGTDLAHELGHTFGLTQAGSPKADTDPNHEGHSKWPSELMFWNPTGIHIGKLECDLANNEDNNRDTDDP